MTTANPTLNLAIGCYNKTIAAIISFGELFDDPASHNHDESGTCHLDELTNDDKNSILTRLMTRLETFVSLMPADQVPDDATVQLFRSKTAGTHRLEISRENLLPVDLEIQETRGVFETLLDITSSDMQVMNDTIFGDGVNPLDLPEDVAIQKIKEYRAGHPADGVWMDFLINGFEVLNEALSIVSLILGLSSLAEDGEVTRD